MKVRVLSDLHFEYHADGGRTFVESLDPSDTDLLVLAGDITTMHGGMEPMLQLFRSRFSCPIAFVHGNHEFYGASRGKVVHRTKDALLNVQGAHWLDCNVVEIAGRRILGTPLWFSESRPPPQVMANQEQWLRGEYLVFAGAKFQMATWSDFVHIEGLRNWVYDESTRAKDFLFKELREGDIVVTHHLPSYESVAERYKGSLTNNWFVNDLRGLIEERKPALWIHGHTHESIDYILGSTRVVCNPFGYLPDMLNPNFTWKKVIDV